jgi:hypothetical protein
MNNGGQLQEVSDDRTTDTEGLILKARYFLDKAARIIADWEFETWNEREAAYKKIIPQLSAAATSGALCTCDVNGKLTQGPVRDPYRMVTPHAVDDWLDSSKSELKFRFEKAKSKRLIIPVRPTGIPPYLEQMPRGQIVETYEDVGGHRAWGSSPACEVIRYIQERIDRQRAELFTLVEAAQILAEEYGYAAFDDGESLKNWLERLQAGYGNGLTIYGEDRLKVREAKRITLFSLVKVDGLNAWLSQEGDGSHRFPQAASTESTGRAQVSEAAPAESKPVGAARTQSGDTDDWIAKAQLIADRVGLERWNSGLRQITARNICEAVAKALADDATTHGQQGPRTADNVRTVGLKGWRFKPPT